jgi:hypothetical protein
MKLVRIDHRCGHSEEHKLYGGGREQRLKRRSLRSALCGECLEAEREKRLVSAVKWNRRRHLCKLHGQASQVESAELIRHRLFNFLRSYRGPLYSHPNYGRALALLKNKYQSSWWLNKQRFSEEYFLELAIDEAEHEERLQRLEPEIERRLHALKPVFLSGSDKQVHWARILRHRVLHEALSFQLCVEECLKCRDHWHRSLDEIRHIVEELPAEMGLLIEQLNAVGSSVFWIEYRDKTLLELARILKADEKLLKYMDLLNGKMAFLLNL